MTGEAAPGPRTVRIGLTGPIGCGKSTIAGWLAERGAMVIDADVVAREVSAPGEPAHDAVIAAFGDAVRVDGGRLDRAALARVVFADPEALRRLVPVDPQAQLGLASFAEAEKLRGLSKTATKAN